MELSVEAKEALEEILTEAGYEGHSKGEFIINGKKLIPQTIISRAGIPGVLRNIDPLKDLYIQFKDNPGEAKLIVTMFLKEIPYEGGYVGNPEGSQEVESDYVQTIKDDMALFKTIKAAGVYDPRSQNSSGVSVIAFNTKKRMILDGRVISIDAILRVKGIKREEIPEAESIPFVWPEFNPYIPDLTFNKYIESFGSTIQCLNTAVPPNWMADYSKEKPEVRGFIKKLILHLFPDPEERDLVLDWCHFAIFKRNGTVLCLAGERGTGKSTFIEILSELIGTRYTEIVNQAILEEKFNAQFFNKRLIIFEEVALEDSVAINKVKAWCNNKISVEEKGKDAFSADNFTSMVFLINRLEELRINAQERRFSIPVLASENLLTVCTEEEIDDFKTKLAAGDPEVLREIAAFGFFLKEREPKTSEHVPIRGQNFNRVADLSLAEWQSSIRDYIQAHGVAGDVIPIHVILPPTKSTDDIKPPRKKSTVENFLRDYRYLGKYKIGDVVDLSDAEIAKFNNTQKRPIPTGGRTRRMYGIRPREEFLLHCSKKENREDLL